LLGWHIRQDGLLQWRRNERWLPRPFICTIREALHSDTTCQGAATRRSRCSLAQVTPCPTDLTIAGERVQPHGADHLEGISPLALPVAQKISPGQTQTPPGDMAKDARYPSARHWEAQQHSRSSHQSACWGSSGGRVRQCNAPLVLHPQGEACLPR